MREGCKGGAESCHRHQAGARRWEADLFRKEPVTEKVKVTDGVMLDFSGGMHGIGFMNVKAVADKYGGDFAVLCDKERFQVVVML